MPKTATKRKKPEYRLGYGPVTFTAKDNLSSATAELDPKGAKWRVVLRTDKRAKTVRTNIQRVRAVELAKRLVGPGAQRVV
jgi:hypothetical protein